MSISPLAYVHSDAQLGKNVIIEPFAVVHGDAVIGDNVHVHSHAIIHDGARIGDGCQIFQGAAVGSIPQDLKFNGEDSTLEIGNNTVIREYCTLNRGTAAHGKTSIGADCLLMAYVHVAHDCIIGNHCILVNNVNLGGHVEVGEYAIISAMSMVHQFVKIGPHTMISGGSLVRKDVPPFIKAARTPLAFAGVNSIGLKRRGYTADDIHVIQEAYRRLYLQGLNNSAAVEVIRNEVDDTTAKAEILDFIAASDRGLIKGLTQR